MLGAAEHLADHIHEAPVWIVPCLAGPRQTGSGASIFLAAVQNMLRAARAGGSRGRQCSAVGSVDIHFTSDHHWGHAAARSFYSRPFSSLAEMDQVTEGKHLVVGNNDDATATDCDGWQSIQQYAELVIDGIRLVLCHYPFRTWRDMDRDRSTCTATATAG